MKTLALTAAVSIGSLLLWSFEAVAYEDECAAQTAEQRTSWISGIDRRLHNHDPAKAAEMSKVASEIINGEADALKGDLASGLDSNAVLKMGEKSVSNMSLLALAAAACQLGIAEQLLAGGASANGVDYSTPLVVAGGSGATSLAELLIEHGASVDKVDEEGHTALEDAVRQHHLATVQLLLLHGSNPNLMVSGGRGTITDLVAHSSEPTAKAIASALYAHGGAPALSNLPREPFPK